MGWTVNECPGRQNSWLKVEFELCLLLMCWEFLCHKHVFVCPMHCFLHLLHCIKYIICLELQFYMFRIAIECASNSEAPISDGAMYFQGFIKVFM